MLINWIRSLTNISSSLTDVSLVSQDETGFSCVLTTADYLYIGQSYPFNSIYLQVGTANSNSSVLSGQYYDNGTWRDFVDFIDGTSTTGKTLAKSGVVIFTPNKSYVWSESLEYGNNYPTELGTTNIYNMYWMRLKVSANLSAGTIIKKIAYSFTTGTALTSIDPDINEYLTNWAAAKTDWNDQIVLASSAIIIDLLSTRNIKSPAQILRPDELYIPTAYKTLSIIYGGLGKDFVDRRDWASKLASEYLSKQPLTVDLNKDAIITQTESKYTNSRVYR